MSLSRTLTVSTFLLLAFFVPFDTLSEMLSEKSNFSNRQVKDVEKIVYNYLTKNPEVITKLSRALQKKEASRIKENSISLIKKNITLLFDDPKSPHAGSLNGDIKIVDFFDYECGHCKVMANIIKETLKNNPHIEIIFKESPILNTASKIAAIAALASMKQGKYYQFNNALFNLSSTLDESTIFRTAESVGINVKKLKKEMREPWIKSELESNFKLFSNLKLRGTPTFIFSDKKYSKFSYVPGQTSKANFEHQISFLR